MANVGRISGPLLKSNLLRNGVDLAFETDLLYLDVSNGRVGIKNTSPTYELDITGTARASELRTTLANIDDVQIDNNLIKSTVGDLILEPATDFDQVIIRNRVYIPNLSGHVASFENFNLGDLQITDNIIEPINTNDDLIIRANGSGSVNIYGLTVSPDGDIDIDGGRLDLNNIRIEGDADNTGLFALNSNTDMNISAAGTGRVYLNGVDILLDEGNTYYVTANGNDSNDGNSIQTAFATIQQAVSVATFGDTIKLMPGTYTEITPIDLPQGVTLTGSGLRSTQVKPDPTTRTNDVFRLDGDSTVENLTVREVEYDSLNDTGYAFCYVNNASIARRSAYVKDITVLNFGSSVRLGTNAADDSYGFDAGDAGRGAIVDGSKIASGSIEAAMLFDSVTFIVPNSKGLVLTEGARAEWLNSFVYFADVGVDAFAGTTGKFGDGKTYIELGNISNGPFQAGDTVTFSSTDGSSTTSCLVESVDGDTIVVDGRFDGLDGFDLTFEDSTASISGDNSGATATSVIRYDRKEFGAELRSIASANVYGNFGVRADGPGVRLRLSSHDFGYIGVGKSLDNIDNDVVTANEITEVNGGRIFYNSTDQYGDYRIGDLFYVDQDSGAVTFSSPEFNITALTGITFTDGLNETVIDAEQVKTGNIRIFDNDIVSLSGDITINPLDNNPVNLTSPVNISGNTSITGNQTVSGNLDVDGNITVGGNITLGDVNVDSITISADFQSNLIPDTDRTYDIGTLAKRWNNVFAYNLTASAFDVDTIQTDDIRISGNRIETTQTESDLELVANGNGSVTVRDTFITYGDAFIFGQLTSQQVFNAPKIITEDVVLEQNTIHTQNSDSNLELYAAGTGLVLVRENALVQGNLEVIGDVTIGGNLNLGNQETDSITVVADFTSNLLPNASNLYDLGSISKGWKELHVGQVNVDDIVIDTQKITTTGTNANLQLDANGTGVVEIVNPGLLIPVGDTSDRPTAQTGLIRFNTDTVQFEGYQGTSWSSLGGVRDVDNDTYIIPEVSAGSDEDTLYFYTGGNLSATLNSTELDAVRITVDNIAIDNSVITVTDTDGNLELTGNGDGYVDFTQTNAIKIPVGTELQRPAGVQGQIRFNTDTSQFEGYQGASWSSLGGVRDIDNDTFIVPELTPGGDQDTLYFYAGGKLAATISASALSVLDQNIQNNELRINDNRIETYNSNTDLILDANGLGTVNINTNTYIDGFLDVSGDIFLGGNIRIGDQDIDTITVIADFTSDLLPNSPNQYSLGNITKGWKELHTGHIFADSIEINDSYIRTIDSDANLELSASGNGVVEFTDTTAIKISVGDNSERPGTAASGMIRFNTDTTQFEGYNGIAWSSLGGVRDVDNDTYIVPETAPGADEDTLYFYTGGTLVADFSASALNLDEIEIVNNQISTNVTDADLVLAANGNGVVYISGAGAVRIPAGGNADRPDSFADAGWIRWNTDTNSIEAWNGVQFQAVGGGTSSDANGDTLITFETLGNNEDIIRFYAGIADPANPLTGSIASNEIATISNEGLLVSGKIRIQDNVIENTVSDEDLIIRASGTGRVRIDGGGQESSEGNVFLTDPLFTLNEVALGSNQVDMGIILERGSDINAGMIFDESEDAFAFVKTIEQGTVKGNVAITDYWDAHVASIKLNSETANKITFTDANKVVRSLDSGEEATVGGSMLFDEGTSHLAIPSGTEIQRPSVPQAGHVRYNQDTEQFEGYYGEKGWGSIAYAQGTPADHQKFLGDGATFEFLLKKDPQSVHNIIVAINGVIQEPDFAYTVDGRILRFIDESSTVVSPEDEARIDVRFLSAPALHTVRRTEHTGDGSTRRFASSIEITDAETVMVFVENIYQDPAVYSVDGAEIVFSEEAPGVDDRISIINFATVSTPNIVTKAEADDSAIVYAIALG